MSGIRIVAKTTTGQRVIEQVIAADNGRNDWQMFFTERIETTSPYRIVIEHKNRAARAMVSAKYLEAIAKKQLDALGAMNGLDYEVELL